MSQHAKKPAKRSHSSKIRIIAGDWRGRKLDVLDADGLRPTGDRIRETLFNWLAPWITQANCLDAYAGTGALGLEALSRGATHVQFIENGRNVAEQLKSNLSVLKCTKSSVAQNDCLDWLSRPAHQTFDLVFVDPPFQHDLWSKTLFQLDEGGWLSDEAMVYVESPKNTDYETPIGWIEHRQIKRGHVRATLYKTNT